ncbi:MAG TPA: hypothetical protein VF527_19385 [Pyrinomonadaceae bacterium]
MSPPLSLDYSEVPVARVECDESEREGYATGASPRRNYPVETKALKRRPLPTS